MALTIQAIKTEGEAIMKSMYPGAQESDFQVTYACDTLLDLCLITPVDKWKGILNGKSKSGQTKIQEKFSTMYKGHLKDPQNKNLAERIMENPKMLNFFSAIVVKLFDALTYEHGKLPKPTDQARAEKLGQDIVMQYLTFKRTQTKFPKRWDMRLALDQNYRQHFRYAIDENDLDALKDDLSGDEVVFERKRKFEDIPEETKLPKYEYEVYRIKEEYEKSKAATDNLEKKYRAALKDKKNLQKKRQAKKGIDEIAETLCAIQNKPSTKTIKMAMETVDKFCKSEFDNKTENPYKIIVLENLVQTTTVAVDNDPPPNTASIEVTDKPTAVENENSLVEIDGDSASNTIDLKSGEAERDLPINGLNLQKRNLDEEDLSEGGSTDENTAASVDGSQSQKKSEEVEGSFPCEDGNVSFDSNKSDAKSSTKTCAGEEDDGSDLNSAFGEHNPGDEDIF